MNVEEVAERALGHAQGEALAAVIGERSVFARFARSRPTQLTAGDEFEVQVSCVRDGHVGSATTNALADDALRDCARRAGLAADLAARTGRGVFPGLPAPADTPTPHTGWDEETARLPPEAAAHALGAVLDVAAADGLQASGLWTAGEVCLAVASSTGVRAKEAVTDVALKVICRAESGRTGYAAAGADALGAVEPWAVARRAAAKVASSGEPATLPPGEYPAVLEAEAVADLLDFTGALAFNGLAYAEGRSAVSDRLGKRVAAPGVNLSDSPRFHATLPRAFDAEGVPKTPLPLIQDGIAHRVVHDTRSAAIVGDGAASTGHALVAGGSPSGPWPTNLVLVGGGAAGVEELAAPIERGIYVTRLWYVNPVRPKETLLTGVTRDGTFLIEDGQITRPVADVRFTDSALGLLARTEALSARPRLVARSEFYGRRFAYGVVCPAVRVSALRITG